MPQKMSVSCKPEKAESAETAHFGNRGTTASPESDTAGQANSEKIVPPVTPNILYFGFKQHYGHALQSKLGRVDIYTDTPWGVSLDGGLLVNVPDNPNGLIKQHRKDGWTALCFWDRSGDSRPNSNSAFLVHDAEISAEDLLARARVQWPEIFARPGFPIK